eukprot:scaffold99544_cov36-Prasinocladus_malaysianus.AAC.3
MMPWKTANSPMVWPHPEPTRKLQAQVEQSPSGQTAGETALSNCRVERPIREDGSWTGVAAARFSSPRASAAGALASLRPGLLELGSGGGGGGGGEAWTLQS